MDFRSPEPVIDTLREAVERGVFGYGCEPEELKHVIAERMWRLYQWKVEPDAVIFLPGVIQGLNVACLAFTQPGDGVLVQTPVYGPIVSAHRRGDQSGHRMQLTPIDGSYMVDLQAFEAAINDRTRLFVLCNPHNPVGRAFRRDELSAMADVCLRHNLLICSDEIHCDLIYSGHKHAPIASLNPEVERRTITLMAPSKTFNLAGLRLAFAIIPDTGLRRRFVTLQRPLAGGPNILGVAAALAAYRSGQDWLDQVLAYLEGNRDWLCDYVARHLPGLTINQPEATYLAWLDCRRRQWPDNDPFAFFLNKAKVALSAGPVFGPGGEGFLRLNFGCPRPMLASALERMRAALEYL
jgi:cystathionine beta-lyase